MKFYEKDWVLFQEIANEGGTLPSDLKETNVKDGNPDENKHVPYITKTEKGYKVSLGKTGFHANDSDHHINFVQIIIDDSLILTKSFPYDVNPEYEFFAPHGKVVKAYAFCNLHGMWKNTL
ncbi:MAG: desulfoferrodoxin family protein [Malacoplasma sp.]